MNRSGKILMFFLALAAQQTHASGDGCDLWCGEYPNAYFITPANDSRGNLGLVLEDQGIVHYAPKAVPFHYDEFAGAPGAGEPATQNPNDFASLAAGLGVAANSVQEAGARLAGEHFGRCLTDNAQAVDSLLKSLQSSNLPIQDKTLLAGERLRFAGLCEKSLEVYKPLQVSDAAKPYARYLEAAAAFYAGQYDRAAALFQSLSADAKPGWVQETSLYMLGRVALNHAQVRYDGWSELNAETIDRTALGKAASAFNAYLKAFPQGRYADSAKGLFRKIHWLSADGAALTADYQAWATKIRPGVAGQALLDFINETESKSNPVNAPVDALWSAPLLAMQHITASWRPGDDGALQQKTLVGVDAVNAHRSQFADAGLEALWSYLALAHRYWVAGDYDGVIQQTAADAATGKLSNIAYSRRTLRGLALTALQRWPEAEAHWQSLLKTVEHPGQKIQTQWLLALTWSQQGRLDDIYARDSTAGNSDIRDYFIHAGKPELLESLLKREDLPSHSRSLAYFTLMNQFVRHRDFKAASAILSAHPASGYALARDMLAPLAWAGQKGEYACPSFSELLAAIQQTPAAAQRLNCMGDFSRTQNWDYSLDVIADENVSDEPRHRWHDLADYGLPFKNKPVDAFGDKSGRKIYSSLDYYMDVINQSGKVASEDMAYALHRAMSCFASSGNNHCGDQNIPKEQRGAWFKRLKSEFKDSRWAKEQKYYW
ncbi:hypothetical protein F6R98_14000 [Candidatus Methylospira mobilis]|uniref:Tetratricopeptide repeat protein n=1 Tax=Candidatus Methylospira mobilis TaxID=1808979 RepID=A0A5Q0BPD5_9GAMM|nr:hypothetical protein [Candidatus Methylospira mobilis]QFY43596.1 hypothetical protein F6R98_14000 [Candidatus Methylospira mobilis]